MPGGTWVTAKRDLSPSKYVRFANFIDYLFMTNGEEIFSSTDGINWGTDNLINTVPISSISYVNPTVTLGLAEGHGISTGDSIVIAGVKKALPITNITYATPNVTMTVATGHDVKIGDEITIPILTKTIAITNVTYANPNITLTVSSGHNVLPGNIITISGLDYAYNGDYSVSSVTATTIVYVQAGLSSPVLTTGSIAITEAGYFINITNVAYTDPNITLTVPTGHNITSGTIISVSGLDTAYNGTFTVTSVTATTVVYQKAALSAPVDKVGLVIPQNYSGVATVTNITATTIVFQKTGLPTPYLISGTLSAIDRDYNGVHTVTASYIDSIQYIKSGIVSTSPLSMGYFTIDFTLAGKDILEYSNLLYIIGLKNFESDFIWCDIPTRNAEQKYEISWSKSNALTIATGDGEDLVGGIVCRGAMYLFKNSSLYRIIAPVEDNGYQEISKNIGASDRRNMAVVNSSIIFFCEGRKNVKPGFYMYNPLTDSEPKIISELSQPYIDGMSSATQVVAEVRKDLYIAYIGPIVNKEYDLDIANAYWVYNSKDKKCLGIYDLGVPSTYMAQVVVQGKNEFCSGDNNGGIWMLDYGSEDAVEYDSGEPIEMEAISQVLDIAQTTEGTRGSYIKTKVRNVWVYGDHLENLEFFYRFNPKQSDNGGWIRKRGMRGPVHHIPIKMLDVYTWQFGYRELSRSQNTPIIRKTRIEYE